MMVGRFSAKMLAHSFCDLLVNTVEHFAYFFYFFSGLC